MENDMDDERRDAEQAGKEQDVWRQLETVLDPELDEPITDLRFVDRVDVVENDVKVSFRLPTYWCAPNFAFLMTSDIREHVSRLAWVARVEVALIDHCTSDQISEGVTHGQSFEQVFGAEAAGNLDELRSTFRRKAFKARQERLLRQLKTWGWSVEAIVRLTVSELSLIVSADGEYERLRLRYLEIRSDVGLHGAGDSLAFTTVDGGAISVEVFETYLRGLRTCRLNMEINTHFCRSLLAVRYGVTSNGDDNSPARESMSSETPATVGS